MRRCLLALAFLSFASYAEATPFNFLFEFSNPRFFASGTNIFCQNCADADPDDDILLTLTLPLTFGGGFISEFATSTGGFIGAISTVGTTATELTTLVNPGFTFDYTLTIWNALEPWYRSMSPVFSAGTMIGGQLSATQSAAFFDVPGGSFNHLAWGEPSFANQLVPNGSRSWVWEVRILGTPELQAIPEPSSLLLLATGFATLYRRRLRMGTTCGPFGIRRRGTKGLVR
jgi:hypothetical protein